MALMTFSGLASGIDSAAFIDAFLDQERKVQVNPYEDKISGYEDQNSALKELSGLLSSLQSSVSGFRAVNGGILSHDTVSSDETVATAIASNSAANGTYALTVSQTASNGKVSFDDRFSGISSKLYAGINDGAAEADRTVSFTIGNGDSQETVDVVVDSSTTVSSFIEEFNSSSNNASATSVNVGTVDSPSYAIIISSENTGTDTGEIAISVGSAVSDTGSGAFNSHNLDQATDAEFTIDGITGTITRSSNTVSDVLAGATFNLNSTGSATLSIGNDPEQTLAAVEDFVKAYNDIVNFVKDNDLVERTENGNDVQNIFGPLAKTSLDESILSTLKTDLTSAGISGTQVNILADLGMTSERDGTLKFDEETFRDALEKDSSAVGSIMQNLGESLGAVDGTIAQFTRFNGLIDLSIQESDSMISGLQDKIGTTEKRLSDKEDSLRNRFARLEAMISQMQSQQSHLSSILGSI